MQTNFDLKISGEKSFFENLCTIRWIVKICIEKLKTKMLIFYKQQSYFGQIVSKKAKITMKNPKNNNIIFLFYFCVSNE